MKNMSGCFVKFHASNLAKLRFKFTTETIGQKTVCSPKTADKKTANKETIADVAWRHFAVLFCAWRPHPIKGKVSNKGKRRG
jgi:hypothetical protein